MKKTHDPAPPPPNQPIESGRFAYDGLERTVHEKARLGIITSLAMHPTGLVFSDLKKLCDLTDGNLNRHLAVLEEEKLVEVWKSGGAGRRQTMYRITNHGRKRLLDYLAELEQVVEDVARATKAAEAQRNLSGGSPGGGGGGAGWRKVAPA